MDKTKDVNIAVHTFGEYIEDKDVFADLDDDPPELKNMSKRSLTKAVKQKIGVISQVIIGSLVGGIVSLHAGSDSGNSKERNKFGVSDLCMASSMYMIAKV